MAFTPHGYQIPGTPEVEKTQPGFVPCGGLTNCKYCIHYAATYSATFDSLSTSIEKLPEGVIWEAKDETDNGDKKVCEISRIPNGWLFAVTEGHFSGYPEVPLTRADLVKLRYVIDKELS